MLGQLAVFMDYILNGKVPEKKRYPMDEAGPIRNPLQIMDETYHPTPRVPPKRKPRMMGHERRNAGTQVTPGEAIPGVWN